MHSSAAELSSSLFMLLFQCKSLFPLRSFTCSISGGSNCYHTSLRSFVCAHTKKRPCE